MSLVCIAAARARVIPFWLAVTVAVLGGLGPFCGSAGFVIAERRRARTPGGRVEFRNGSRYQHRASCHARNGRLGQRRTVLEWHKQEGDTVAADETLVEISTDKVDAEVPAPVAGTVIKIHAGEGDTVAVGGLLAEIAASDGAPVADEARRRRSAARVRSTACRSRTPAPNRRHAAEPEPAALQSAGATIDIVTPTGGESVTEGTILEWAVKVGDQVKDGDTVVEISTDKVDMELPAPTSGTITEILAQEGETVTVGQVIGRMTAGAPDGRGPASRAPARRRRRTGGRRDPRRGHDRRPRPATPAANASPVARRVAAAEGIDINMVTGTARGGRITKSDVLSAGNGAAAAPPAQAPSGAELIKGSGAALARYMEQSRSIPTATSFRTLTVTALDQRRKQLKDAGRRVSFTHLIAYAIARVATDEMPVMANHFAEVDGKPHRVRDGAVNLGLAVDVERKDGSRSLIVPVIRDAGSLSFGRLCRAVRRARPEGPRQHVDRRRPDRRQPDAHQPGRDRHDRLGPAADGRPGHDRRDRLDRISRRARERRPTGRRGEGHDDDLDLRSPRHPGRRVGALPGPDRGPAQGRGALLRAGVLRSRGRAAAAAAARRAGARHRSSGRGARRAGGPRRDAAECGAGGHVAAEGPPHARPPGGPPGPARAPTGGRPGARSRSARPDARADGEDSGPHPADVRPGRHARRRAPAPARDLLRHDRLRDRAHRLAPPAAVAARGDRVGDLPPAAARRGAEGAAQAADRGRRVRALHA